MIPTADLRPLSERVPMGEALASMRRIEAGLPKRLRRPLGFLSGMLVILIVFTVGFQTYLLADQFTNLDGTIDWGMVGIGVIWSFMPLTACVVLVTIWVTYVLTVRRRWKLARLASANGWSYDPWSPVVPPSGMYFRSGTERDVSDRIVTPSVEVGRFLAKSGSGRSQSTVRTEYACLVLPRLFPHIVLDATANDTLTGRSNLVIDLRGEQRLDLEGDFPKHFRLSAPVGYEQDALYLFTPDVMAILVDHARAFDIEIVDDRLFLYAASGIVTTDAAAWTGLLTAVDALRTKIAAWERWRDDRLNPVGAVDLAEYRRRGVAAPGKRLREKTPWFWIILGGLAALYGLYALGTEFFTWVFSLG